VRTWNSPGKDTLLDGMDFKKPFIFVAQSRIDSKVIKPRYSPPTRGLVLRSGPVLGQSVHG